MRIEKPQIASTVLLQGAWFCINLMRIVKTVNIKTANSESHPYYDLINFLVKKQENQIQMKVCMQQKQRTFWTRCLDFRRALYLLICLCVLFPKSHVRSTSFTIDGQTWSIIQEIFWENHSYTFPSSIRMLLLLL